MSPRRRSMLARLIRRRLPLTLHFEQRECAIVPQTAGLVALHAGVYFTAIAPGPAVAFEDAWLSWTASGATIRRSRWGRAIASGKFRYPPQPLGTVTRETPLTLSLTFTDPLIPHPAPRPPPESLLTLELVLTGGDVLRRDLWRVRMSNWDGAYVEWLVTDRNREAGD